MQARYSRYRTNDRRCEDKMLIIIVMAAINEKIDFYLIDILSSQKVMFYEN
jgi:hypothetical protein